MGMLIDGQWKTESEFSDDDGEFRRQDAPFRGWITADGAPGPDGADGFPAARDRYHLYVGYACPWAHRTLIYRSLKGLKGLIPVSFVHWFMGEEGWTFEPDGDDIVEDQLYGSARLHELYTRADPDHTGRVTIPVLWDRERETIVSNESSEIIRMFDSAFAAYGAAETNYLPDEHRDDIESVNERVYHTLNNGVYKSGFARTQSAYEAAVGPLFDTLDWLEVRLGERRFLHGDRPLESDWRLLPTLLRFDLVYHGHFKCNVRRLVDYPNLWGYTRDLYQWPGIAETCHFGHAKRHYYSSHESVNPTRIVPVGPAIDFETPHGRGS